MIGGGSQDWRGSQDWAAIEARFPERDFSKFKCPEDSSDVEYLSDLEDYKDIETYFFQGPATYLYWNMEHYPIGADLESIYTNIKLALHKKGIHGELDVYVYGGRKPKDAKDYVFNFTFILPPVPPKSVSSQISRDILFSAKCAADEKPTVVVFSRLDTELHRVLQCLQSRNHYVLKLVPTAQFQDAFFDSVDSVFESTLFLDGGKTRGKTRPRRSAIKPITGEGENAAVFWDVEDFPFPLGPTPDMIYHQIRSAFMEWKVPGNMSIYAYVDQMKESWGEFMGNKTHDSRIDFYPAGAKPARLERMLNDILLWVIDHPVDRPRFRDVIVLTGKVRYDFRFFSTLQDIESRGYNVCLVTLATDPESSEWPGLLLEHAHVFGLETESEKSQLDQARVSGLETETETETEAESSRPKKFIAG